MVDGEFQEGASAFIKAAFPAPGVMTPPALDGWPDVVAMATNETYAREWYRLHASER